MAYKAATGGADSSNPVAGPAGISSLEPVQLSAGE